MLSLEPTLLLELKMRGKRSKQYRKLMQQYGMVFGFREPYQVLGTFDRVALSDTLLLIALCTVDAQTIQDTEHFKMDLLSGAFIPAIIKIHVLEANRFLFLRLGAYTQRCVDPDVLAYAPYLLLMDFVALGKVKPSTRLFVLLFWIHANRSILQ